MTTITNLINMISEATVAIILFSIWAFAWIAVVIKFLDIAKMALHYLFPNMKWFQ